MIETIASFLGGLGLFFLGVRQLGQNLQAMAGPRLRRWIAQLTRGPLSGAAAGLGLGMLTQSSSAVTFLAANMQASGLVSVAAALPVLAWANLGTTLLVLLATLDMRAAALMLLGLAGIAHYFNLDGGRLLRLPLQAAVGIGLIFLGLSLLKAGAAPLRDAGLLQDFLALTGHAALPAFFLGVVVTMLAQSSSTITILAISLFKVGVLTFGEAEMAIYGASLGSGLATYIISGGLTGTTRQLVLYQVMFKAFGAAVFVALHLLGASMGVTLETVLPWLLPDGAARLGLLFALMQLVTALAMIPLNARMLRLLAARAPANASESLSRPIFLYDAAARDASSALTLARREQNRLLARIPVLLNAVREGAIMGNLPAAELSATARPVEVAVQDFLGRLMRDAAANSLRDEAMAEAVRLDQRNRLLRELRQAVTDFAVVAEEAAGTAPLPQLAEAMHLLLEQLAELHDAEEAATLLSLTEDRGAMMRRLREANGAGLSADRLHRATAAFERAVWLTRNLVTLELEAGERAFAVPA